MQFKNLLISLACVLAFSMSSVAQQAQSTGQPPQDKPFATNEDDFKKIEEAIKPHIEEAKKKYPDAKKRFLAGLPANEHFYITVRLRDEIGRFEQSFIAVDEIKDGIVKGVIANEITLVKKYKRGDEYSFSETELIDWTITKADGTEEGNFVGKFLDTYRP